MLYSTSLPRRATLVAQIGLFLNLLACGPTQREQPEADSAAVTSLDRSLLRARLTRTRDAFLALDAPTYRRYVIQIVGQIEALPVSDRQVVLQEVLASMSVQGDGLEAIALACADGIASVGTPSDLSAAAARLSEARVNYRFARPFPAMLVPIGRYHSRVFVDLRPDAARALMAGLLRSPSLLGLDQLQGLGSVRVDTCKLPELSPEVRTAHPDLDAADIRRKAFCTSGGAGGSGLLGALEASSCLDAIGPDSFALSDAYTTEEMARDLEACMDSLGDATPVRGLGRDNLSFGWIVQLGKFLAPIVLPILIEKGVEYMNSPAPSEAPSPSPSASSAPAPATPPAPGAGPDDAQAARDAADAALNTALEDEARAKDDYDRATAATDAARAATAQTGLSDAERNARQAAYDDAKRREKEAADTLARAKLRREEKEDAATKAHSKAMDAFTPPDPMQSPACQRLMGGGRSLTERLWIDQGSSDVREWRQQALDRKSKPRPDSDPVTAGEAFFLPSCGEGKSVVAVSCDAVAMCRDPSTQCGCRGAARPRDEAMNATMRGVICSAVVRCPEGQHATSFGQSCACAAEDIPPSGRQPRPAPIGFALQRMTARSAELPKAGSFTRLATDLMRRDGGRSLATR